MRALLAMAVAAVTASQCGATSATSVGALPPMLPTQFRADVTIMSHLTDPRQTYPPSVRRMHVQYDLQQQLAKAEMLEGYETNKTYVRQYGQKREYMVKHGGAFEKCERVYLGETMPAPEIPFAQEFLGVESVKGLVCEHWIHSYANVRVHIYSDVKTHVPIRSTEENFVGSVPTMLLMYDLDNVDVGPQSVTDFAIPRGYTHKECSRNVGGFPYIHVFHYYLRF